jgi:hypothetical protein
VEKYLLKFGLPGVVILGLAYAVLRLYSDLQSAQEARIKELSTERANALPMDRSAHQLAEESPRRKQR